MMNTFRSSLLIAFFASTLTSALPLRCGGEGPKPFNDISPKFDHRVEIINTVGGVKEFTFWEKHNAVLFRNHGNELRALPLVNNPGGGYQPILSILGMPLSNITEPAERFLLTQNYGWVYDRLGSPDPWVHFSTQSDLRHQFWGRNKLYSIREVYEGNHQFHEVYSYKVGETKAEKICGVSGGAQGYMQLAKGSSYPTIVLYSSRPGLKGTDLFIHELDVKTCKVKEQVLLGVMGPVRDVHVFDEQKSLAIHVQHPSENLLWFTPDGCQYHNVGDGEVLVPNYHKPILATRSSDYAFQLYFLESQSSARLLKGVPIGNLAPNDIYLTNQGGKLFLAPHVGNELSKMMLKITVSPNALPTSEK